MKLKNAVFAFAVAVLATAASSASAVDFHGYLRAGVGGNSNGGGQVCFQNPGNWWKFRLGNECDIYSEMEFGQSLYKDKSGLEFKYTGMLSMGGGGPVNPAQSWVGATIPALGNAQVWAGNRYYMRNDVHALDAFYWNPSGAGGGIEAVDLGFGKFAFAVFQSNSSDRRTIWRPDIRIYGIPVNPNGSLEVGLDVFYDSSQTRSGLTTGNPNPDRQKISPWVTVQHTQTNLLGGSNKLAFQYATGSAAQMQQFPVVDSDSKRKSWRIVDHFVYQPTEKFSGSFAVIYWDQSNAAGQTSDNQKQLYLGIRPAYTVNDWFKLEGEVGYSSLTPKEGVTDSRTLTKITLAPTITPPPGPGGAYFTRPVIRLFATYGLWNSASKAAGFAGQPTTGTCDATTSGSAFKCDTNGLTFGAQAEAWW